MIDGEWGVVLLALGSAATFGAGDFSGGLASKRAAVYTVIITAQGVGAVFIIGLALLFQETIPPTAELVWGALAGVTGSAGLVLLYRALATGRMGLAAPLSAVVAAALPVLVGISREGFPAPTTLIGFAAALVAVWLIAASGSAVLDVRALLLPLISGVFFGVFFVLLDLANDNATFWPLAAARAASLVLVGGLALLTRQPLVTPLALVPLTALAGILDAVGNALYVLAAGSGRLDVAAVLVSLYPASTILLAWLLLKEPINRVQAVGILLALVAIALIAA